MTIQQLLAPHHTHCDDLFAAAEASAQNNDWSTCATENNRFADALRAHLDAEETVLFPAFEQATGMTGGPTQVMRMEHGQMRGLLDQMAAAQQAQDADAYAGAAETLLILMQQHNMKEENILYPMCDDALAAQADDVAAKLSERLATT